jgi:HK97 family phage major capsid protein
MTREQLLARLAEIAGELRDINTAAGDAELTEEQTTRFTELEAEHAERTGQLEAAERRATVEAARAKWGSVNVNPAAPDDSIDARTAPIGDVQRRARGLLDDKAIDSRHLSPEQRQRVDTLLTARSQNIDGGQVARMAVATENPAYRGAFAKMVTRGNAAFLTPDESRALQQVEEMRVAMSSTDGNGGYAVPTFVDPTVILTGQETPNPFYQAGSRVEQITNDKWVGLTSAGATWYWTTEAVASTDGAPTLASPEVPTKKITGWIPFSVEIQGDWPGFAGEMARVLGAGYNEAVVAALTNGLGTTAQPTGLVRALKDNTAVQLLVTTDGVIGAADFYRLWKALPAKYRGTSSWMMSTGVENAMRQAGTDDPNFTVNITQAGIPALFNRPVFENDYMDDVPTNSTSDSALAIVGAFENFLIAQRVGMTVETVQHVQNSGVPTGQRGLWAWARLGSDSVNDAGFRMLTND